MSDPITQFGIISRLYSGVCLNYKDDMWTGFFIMMDWWPWYVGFILVGLLLEHAEIFYSLFALAFVADFYINWGLRLAIDSAPPEIYCTTQQQMPAYATDGITFITMSLMILSGACFNFALRWYKIILIAVLGPVAIYSRIWLHNNTPQQLLGGIASGFGNTIMWSTVIFVLLTYCYARLVHSTFLGTAYIDTLTNSYEPVICYNSIPIRANSKIKDQVLLESIIEHSMLQNRITRLHDDDNAWIFAQQPNRKRVETYLNEWSPEFRWLAF